MMNKSVSKRMTTTLGIFLGVFLAGTLAWADDMGGMGDMNGMPDMSSGMGDSTASPAVGHGRGVVKDVDRKAGTVTITHGPIQEFGWSGMTMTFTVRHRSVLDSLKKGEHVGFDVVQDGQGSTIITKIEKKP